MYHLATNAPKNGPSELLHSVKYGQASRKRKWYIAPPVAQCVNRSYFQCFQCFQCLQTM